MLPLKKTTPIYYIRNKNDKTFDYITVKQHHNNDLTINILPTLIRPRPYKESYLKANLTVLDTIIDYVPWRPEFCFEDGTPRCRMVGLCIIQHHTQRDASVGECAL